MWTLHGFSRSCNLGHVTSKWICFYYCTLCKQKPYSVENLRSPWQNLLQFALYLTASEKMASLCFQCHVTLISCFHCLHRHRYQYYTRNVQVRNTILTLVPVIVLLFPSAHKSIHLEGSPQFLHLNHCMPSLQAGIC